MRSCARAGAVALVHSCLHALARMRPSALDRVRAMGGDDICCMSSCPAWSQLLSMAGGGGEMHANRFVLRALVRHKSKDELYSESVCGSRTRSSATILTHLSAGLHEVLHGVGCNPLGRLSLDHTQEAGFVSHLAQVAAYVVSLHTPCLPQWPHMCTNTVCS